MIISGWPFIEVKYGKVIWCSEKLLDSEEACKDYYDRYREAYPTPETKGAKVIYVEMSGEHVED